MVRWPLLLLVAASGPALDPPLSRDVAIADAFRSMCSAEPMDFASINAHATAMRMAPLADDTTPAGNGATIKRKAWTGSLKSGPYGLLVDEMANATSTATSCAISAGVPDADSFRAAIIKALKLPPAPAARIERGARTFEWDRVYGPGTTVIVRDLTPSGQAGIMVKLLRLKLGV